jgi:hypothetical protein
LEVIGDTHDMIAEAFKEEAHLRNINDDIDRWLERQGRPREDLCNPG